MLSETPTRGGSQTEVKIPRKGLGEAGVKEGKKKRGGKIKPKGSDRGGYDPLGNAVKLSSKHFCSHLQNSSGRGSSEVLSKLFAKEASLKGRLSRPLSLGGGREVPKVRHFLLADFGVTTYLSSNFLHMGRQNVSLGGTSSWKKTLVPHSAGCA